MVSKKDMAAYRARWAAVQAIQEQERMNAPIELRWRQLNAAYGMAKGMGLLKPDPSEAGVFQRWAMLKDRWASQHPKI